MFNEELKNGNTAKKKSIPREEEATAASVAANQQQQHFASMQQFKIIKEHVGKRALVCEASSVAKAEAT